MCVCVVINFRSDSDALPSSQAIVLTADVLLHVVLAHVARNLPTGVSVQAASPTTFHSATTMIAVSRFLLSRFAATYPIVTGGFHHIRPSTLNRSYA